MQGLDYWIGTFLSRPDEVAAALLVIVAFGIAAAGFSDERDPQAVLVGTVLLIAGLGIVGAPVNLEWHYWAGGAVLSSVAILAVD